MGHTVVQRFLNTRLENPYLLGSLAVFVLFFLTRRMLLSSFIGVLVFFAAQGFFAGM
jgi:branched-subunit amino acid transport protein